AADGPAMGNDRGTQSDDIPLFVLFRLFAQSAYPAAVFRDPRDIPAAAAGTRSAARAALHPMLVQYSPDRRFTRPAQAPLWLYRDILGLCRGERHPLRQRQGTGRIRRADRPREGPAAGHHRTGALARHVDLAEPRPAPRNLRVRHRRRRALEPLAGVPALRYVSDLPRRLRAHRENPAA